MSGGIFDEYVGASKQYEPIDIKPFHKVKKKSSKEIHKWLVDTSEALLQHNQNRHHLLRRNLAAYRGLTRGYQENQASTPRREYLPTTKTERLVVNHLYDMVETKVAQLSRLKPSIQVLPKHDEFQDKNAARASKMLIDHLFDLYNFDALEIEIQRHKKIFGEAYLFITWNKHLGEKHPDAGTEILDPETGEVEEVPEDLKVGDIEYDVEVPWRVILEHADRFDKSKFCFRVHVEHVDDVRENYPDKKKEIKPNDSATLFDYTTLESVKMKDHVVVFEFWHKGTKNCPEGYYAKFTKDSMLEYGDNPYSHKDFPFERITDLDIPGVMNGVAILEQIKNIQSKHNNLSTLLLKNIYLTAHPKWMVPKGACKIESLGDDATIVQFQGPVAPQLANVTPNSPEVYAFRESLKTEMEQIYSVHGVSRGKPPEGITAGVALQFLNEQEAERASSEIAKKNDFVKNVAKKTLAVCGDYYDPEDGRLVRVLGKENRYLLRHFDSAALSTPYDIKVDLGNALADSKAGKTQRIIELIQYKPDALSPEQAIELLDLGNADKAITQLTAAVRAAESEVEDLLEGRPVADPEEYEDLIVHWRVKVKAMQQRSFKEEVPPEFRAMLIENVTMLEFLMTQKAQVNPKFQAELAQLSLFPIFYKEGFVPQSAEQQALMVQGQANRGEPVSGSVPATSPAPLPGEPKGE